MNQANWGPGAARWVAKALADNQSGQQTGAWIALAGGSLGLVATVLSLWAL